MSNFVCSLRIPGLVHHQNFPWKNVIEIDFSMIFMKMSNTQMFDLTDLLEVKIKQVLEVILTNDKKLKWFRFNFNELIVINKRYIILGHVRATSNFCPTLSDTSWINLKLRFRSMAFLRFYVHSCFSSTCTMYYASNFETFI